MKNTKVSKVMLSSVLGASLFLGTMAISAEVEAPKERTLEKGETQIELPSSAFVLKNKQVQLEEIKAEGERLQKEREEAERLRLAKIEAERKAKEEAERKVREEAERARQAELARQKAIAEEQKRQQAQPKQQSTQQSKGIAFNGSYYTAFCSEGCTGVTATGVNVSSSIYHQGMRVIAVDPNVIPLYSIVQVETPYESFKAIALDTGGAIKGHKVDILVADNATANRLGRHTVHITILRSGK